MIHGKLNYGSKNKIETEVFLPFSMKILQFFCSQLLKGTIWVQQKRIPLNRMLQKLNVSSPTKNFESRDVFPKVLVFEFTQYI